MVKRALRSRPPIAVAPVAVSTENCLVVAGVTARKLRESLTVHADIPRSRIGHTVLVTPVAFYELLRRLQVDPADTTDDMTASAIDEPKQPETAEEVLAEMGLRVAD